MSKVKVTLLALLSALLVSSLAVFTALQLGFPTVANAAETYQITLVGEESKVGVSFDGEEQNTTAVKDITAGDSVVIKAYNKDGYYFTYFTDTAGNKYYGTFEGGQTTVSTVTVTPAKAETYTAHFGNSAEVLAGTGNFTHEGKNSTGQDAFVQLSDKSGYGTNGIISKDTIVKLTYSNVFSENGYLSFDFEAHKKYYNSEFIYVNLDGQQQFAYYFYSYNNYPKFEDSYDIRVIEDTKLLEVSSGYHEIEFIFPKSNTVDAKYEEFFNFKNFEFTTNPETITVNFNYDTRLGKVYMNGEYLAPNESLEVVKGLVYYFHPEAEKSVQSTLNDSEMTLSVSYGLHCDNILLFYDRGESYGRSSLNDFYVKFDGDGKIERKMEYSHGYLHDYKSNKEKEPFNKLTTYMESCFEGGEYGNVVATGSVFGFDFREKAVMPNVQYTLTIDGDIQATQNAKNNDIVKCDIKKQLDAVIAIPDINLVSGGEFEEKFKIKFNGIEQVADIVEEESILDYANKNYVIILNNIVKTTEVSISLADVQNKFEFSEEFKITFMKEAEGDVQTQLNVDTENPVTVVNDGKWWSAYGVAQDTAKPWVIASELSTEEYIAYRAPNSYIVYGDTENGGGAGEYNIGFKFKGSGVLAFDVKLNAYGDSKLQGDKPYWSGYSHGIVYYYNEPVNHPKSGEPNGKSGSSVYGYPLVRGTKLRDPKTTSVGTDTEFPLRDCILPSTAEKEKGVLGEEIEDGWVRCFIPYSAESEDTETTIYVAYTVNNKRNTKGWLDSEDYAAIRNVAFYTGNAYLKTEVSGGSEAGSITYTSAQDDKITEDESGRGKVVPLGTMFNFSVTVNKGYQFYAWKDTEGRIVSYEPSYFYTLNQKNKEYTITAIVEKENKYVARNGDNYYEDLSEALSEAKEKDKVYILQGSLTHDAEVKAGVDLILPLNKKGDYYLKGDMTGVESQQYVAWSTSELEKKYKYLEFTIAANAHLTVNGNFYVGGTLHSKHQTAQAHTSGYYSELINNGNIIIENGGKMDVNGRVTGSGGIEVMSGGNLYQPYLILDFSGGTNTSGLFGAHQTPLERYAMINIQCAGGYKINHGGMLWGHASLFFMGGVTAIDQPFIGYTEAHVQTLINLKDGAYAKGVYEADHYVGTANGTNNTYPIGRTTLTIHGGATAGYMTFPMGITTESVMFSIPYNYNIILEGEKAEYDLLYPYKLMPGATLTVESGATLNLLANFYVYDGLVQSAMSGKTYPTAAELKGAGYSTNANFIVNGKLVIGGEKKSAYFTGLVQTTKVGATIDTTHVYDSYLNERQVVDGARTSYDANTAKYNSTARIYDAVHKVIGTIKGQSIYHSNFAEAEAWVLPATTVTYARNLTSAEINQLYKDGKAKPWKTKQQLIDEEIYYTLFASDLQPTWDRDNANILYQGHQWAEGKTEPVTLTSGGWKIEHTGHHIDWTDIEEGNKTPNNKPTKENPVVVITEYCSEFGCEEHEDKNLLYIAPDYFSADRNTNIEVTYNGKAYSSEDLHKLIEDKFSGFDYVDGFSYTCSSQGREVKNANYNSYGRVDSYSILVTFTNGYYWDNEELAESVGFELIINKAVITRYEIANPEELIYTGEKVTPKVNYFLDDGTQVPETELPGFTPDTEINATGCTGTATYAETANYWFDGCNYDQDIDYTILPKPIQVTINDQTATYDRKEHHPENGTAYWSAAGDAICAADKDDTEKFDITLSGGGTDAQDYDITATVEGTSKDNYTVTFVNGSGEEKSAKFTISPATITGVTVNTDSYVYTGSEIEPGITVSAGSLTLTNGEYTFKFDEGKGVNVDENSTFTVTGTGNFQGTAQGAIAITPKPIDGAEASVTTAPETIIYNGQPWELGDNLAISVTLEGFEDLDYDVSYSEDHTSAGVVTITLTGTGNFGGSKQITFTILQKNISGAEITVNGVQIYTGERLTPADLTVTVDGLPVTYEKEIEYGENINVEGGGTVTVTGNGNYTGTATGHFDITAATISELTVNKEYTYTGKAIQPAKNEVTVKTANGLTLTESDFTLTYGANTETATEASVTAHAASSNYQGEITTNFTINKMDISGGVITFTDGDSYVYNGSAQTPEYTFTLEGFETVDLEQPAYTDNTDVTESAKLTLTGKGNFTGTASKTFSITPLSLSGATVEIETPEGGFVYKAEKWEPKVTAVKLTVGDGEKTLTVTDDYTVTYGNNTNVSDDSKVIITGTGNFKDIAEKPFEITAKDITGATVTIDKKDGFVYKYAEYNPAVTSVVTTDDMTVNSRYYSVTYSKNKDVGTATVTVEGSENFQGTATATFEITQKSATITVNGGNIAIGETPSEFTITISGFYSDYDVQSLTALLDFNVNAPEDLSAGNKYTVTASFKAEKTPANYKVGFVDGEFIIVQEGFEHTAFVGELNVTYDGKAHSLTLTGLPDGAEYELTYTKDGGEGSTSAPRAAGSYKVTAKVTLENGAIYTDLSPATLKISKKTITVTLTNQSVVYNGEQQSAASVEKTDWSMEEGAVVENDEVIITLSATLTGVGSVTIVGSASGKDIDNYDVQFTQATFSVTEKDITGATVKVDGEYTYTGSQLKPEKKNITVSIDGWSHEITFSDAIVYGDNVNVLSGGSVTITGSGNYKGTATGTFAITAATISEVKINKEYIYTGEAIQPAKSDVTVKTANGLTLSENDFTLAYGANTEANDGASVTAMAANSNYQGEITQTFTINKKDITSATVTVSGEYTYTGSPIQPEKGNISVAVKAWDKPITIGTIVCTNNTNAGSADISVTGEGNYTGTATGNFTIKPATVTFSLKEQNYEYTGSKIQPEVTAKWGEGGANTLDQSDNFTVDYGDNTNVNGTNNVTLKLTNSNFTGNTTLTFKITPKDIAGAQVTVSGEYTYMGSQIQPARDKISAEIGGLTVTFSEISYGNNTDVSDGGTVTITGDGNFTGTATGSFEIKAKDITGEATIDITTPANTIIYKNAQWQPEFTVKVNGITTALAKESDYTVSYGDNKNAGENAGTITVNGTGNYTGTAEKKFTILQRQLTLNLKPQEAVYNGTEQSVSSESAYWKATGGVEGDDLQVVLTGSRRDVGSAEITVKSVSANYALSGKPTGTFTITAKPVTVKIKDQSAEYSNSVPTVDQSKDAWECSAICGNDDLKITITKASGVMAGTYNLTGGYTNGNYKVTFVNESGEEKPATFTITKKTVTVTVAPKSSIYGEELEELTYTYDGVISGDGFDIKDHIEISTTATQYADVSGSYTISVKLKGEEAQNYNIDCSSTAEYTLTARPVTYTIEDQSSVYNGKVPQVAQIYTLKEGTVVNNDNPGITVKATGLKKDAGTYVLTGDWSNKNYNVTFEDGEYEITKLDIGEAIVIAVNDESDIDENNTLRVKYEGEPLPVAGMVSSEIEGDEELIITVTTDVTEIVKMGNYTIKATIDDKNYKGEKVFTVIVSDANGYTENIYKVLEELEEKTAGINPDDLKEEDFEALKSARRLINSLTADERAAAGEELAEYEQLIEAWNNATEADGDVIATAKKIADAPVSALIVAGVSAIAMLAYVIGKGGRII